MPIQLAILALDCALYPTLLAAVVILLNQPRRLALLAAYLATGLVVSITAGLLVVLLLKGSGLLPNSAAGLSWGLDLAIGGLALLMAVALATRADQRVAQRRRAGRGADGDAIRREPAAQRILSRGSTPLVMLASLAINLPGAAYLIALKDIAAAHHSTTYDVLLVVAFNAIMFLLAEIPLAGLLVDPVGTDQLVGRVNGWFSRNGRTIATVLLLVLGVFLLTRGIVRS